MSISSPTVIRRISWTLGLVFVALAGHAVAGDNLEAAIAWTLLAMLVESASLVIRYQLEQLDRAVTILEKNKDNIRWARRFRMFN